MILESLVHVKYDEKIELYDKLFKQLQKNSLNMHPKLVSRTLSILVQYKEIFKNDKERGEQVTDLVQFYIDRFNDAVKAQNLQVETEVLFQSLDNIKLLQKLQKETNARELDTSFFFENALRLVEDRMDKSRPETILKALNRFDDEKLRNRFVASILKSMRDNKFDVRRLDFNQLCHVI